MKARLFTDGGARGNPGPAAYAYVLEADDGTVLAAHGEAIGVATNSVAEYRALVEGLRKASELVVDEPKWSPTPRLLVRQMRGEYKVKNEALRQLWEKPRTSTTPSARCATRPCGGSTTRLADRLVNEALDAEGS